MNSVGVDIICLHPLFVYITFLQGVSDFSLLIHLWHWWQNRTLWVWISFWPLGQLGTIGDSSLSALLLCPQRLLGSTLLGEAAASEGNTKGWEQDSPALPSASWLWAHLGEPFPLASARWMVQTSSLTRRLNCQRAPRLQWLQLIGLYLVSGLLWYALLTRMVLFNEDPNLPNSQFKQRHLWKISKSHTDQFLLRKNQILLWWVVRNSTRISHLHASQTTAWLRLGPRTSGDSQGNPGLKSPVGIPIMIFPLRGLPMWSHLLLCRRVDWKCSLLEKGSHGSSFPLLQSQ